MYWTIEQNIYTMRYGELHEQMLAGFKVKQEKVLESSLILVIFCECES